MLEKLVKVEALRELHIPGQKTKRKGAKLELPEATVKILEVGENPSVKRVEVEKVVSTTVNKTTILGESK
jgi:hypothetical protein